jgi:hypothetical protein
MTDTDPRQSTTTRWRCHWDDKGHAQCCEDRQCPKSHHFYEPFRTTVVQEDS